MPYSRIRQYSESVKNDLKENEVIKALENAGVPTTILVSAVNTEMLEKGWIHPAQLTEADSESFFSELIREHVEEILNNKE